MLKLARLRGGASPRPRKEGPEIAGSLRGAGGGGGIGTGAAGRGGSAGRVGAVTTGEGIFGPALAARWVAVSGTAVTGGAGASRVAPHIPQKRLSPGLSLPQRLQRIYRIHSPYSLRYLQCSIQSGCNGGVQRIPRKATAPPVAERGTFEYFCSAVPCSDPGTQPGSGPYPRSES